MKNEKLKIKNLLILVFLFFFFLPFLVTNFVFAAQSTINYCEKGKQEKRTNCPTELVPCGGSPTCPCCFCDFFVLFKKIIDFILFEIIPPVAILMIAIAGFLYIFAYLNPEDALSGGKGGPALLLQAKKILTSVIFGLIIIYSAWLLVNLFFQTIGIEEWTGIKTWWQIKCP